MDGGHRIVNYTLATATGELKSIPTGSSFDIKGLTNGKLYTYHLKAHNAMGGSAPAVITGKPGTKPGPPTINTITPGDQKLTIEFTPPAINGGYSIDNYTLETTTDKHVLTPTESPFEITGLNNSQLYEYHLKAHNAMGESIHAKIFGTPVAAIVCNDDTKLNKENGTLSLVRNVDGKATLTCGPGYKLMSAAGYVSAPEVATCQASDAGNRVGIWSDQTATCQKVHVPGCPVNIKSHWRITGVNDTTRCGKKWCSPGPEPYTKVFCKKGRIQRAGRHIWCKANGKWRKTRNVCKRAMPAAPISSKRGCEPLVDLDDIEHIVSVSESHYYDVRQMLQTFGSSKRIGKHEFTCAHPHTRGIFECHRDGNRDPFWKLDTPCKKDPVPEITYDEWLD
eukprot:342797_1